MHHFGTRHRREQTQDSKIALPIWIKTPALPRLTQLTEPVLLMNIVMMCPSHEREKGHPKEMMYAYDRSQALCRVFSATPRLDGGDYEESQSEQSFTVCTSYACTWEFHWLFRMRRVRMSLKFVCPQTCRCTRSKTRLSSFQCMGLW